MPDELELERAEALEGAHLAAPVAPGVELARGDADDAQDAQRGEVGHAAELEADGRVEEERVQAEGVRGDLERAGQQGAPDDREVAEGGAVLEDVHEVEGRVAGGVVAKQWEGRVAGPRRRRRRRRGRRRRATRRGYGRRDGERSRTAAVTLGTWRWW